MKYFRETENSTARLPAGFMHGFLEVGTVISAVKSEMVNCHFHRAVIERHICCLGASCFVQYIVRTIVWKINAIENIGSQ